MKERKGKCWGEGLFGFTVLRKLAFYGIHLSFDCKIENGDVILGVHKLS